MSSKHIKDMSLEDACHYVMHTSPASHEDCIQLKNDLVEFHTDHAHKRIISMLERSGIDPPRKITIFCNIEFYLMRYNDHKNTAWLSRFIFENDSLAKLYGTFMMPCGEPSRDASWVFLASVFDENFEPYSTLCCNGFRVFKNG